MPCKASSIGGKLSQTSPGNPTGLLTPSVTDRPFICTTLKHTLSVWAISGSLPCQCSTAIWQQMTAGVPDLACCSICSKQWLALPRGCITKGCPHE
jgi:hypothetical protein